MADRKYQSNAQRIKKDEEELEELKKQMQGDPQEEEENESEDEQETEAATTEEVQEEEEKEELDPEEATWKKRYSDLRRHQTKTEKALKEEIDALKEKVNTAPKEMNPEELPKTKKELAEWRKKYPDIAEIVEEIAREQANVMFQEEKKKMDRYDEVITDLSYAQAMSKIRKSHPDLDTILDDDKFHDWVESKPSWFSEMIYEQHEDTNAVNEILNIYKIENGLTKKDQKEQTKKAAKSVATKGKKPEVNTEGEKTLKESDIEQMTEKEFEARYDEIRELRRKGLIELDISGAAR